MAIIHTSRRRGPDPFYRWKVAVFTVGGALGLGAIASDRDWLILLAVPILAVGVGLRWVGRRREDPADVDDPEEDGEPDSP